MKILLCYAGLLSRPPASAAVLDLTLATFRLKIRLLSLFFASGLAWRPCQTVPTACEQTWGHQAAGLIPSTVQPRCRPSPLSSQTLFTRNVLTNRRLWC